MKMIFVVIVQNTDNGKYYACPDTIKTGENLKAIFNRYNTDCVHLCESRKQAEALAIQWNEDFKKNGTFGY